MIRKFLIFVLLLGAISMTSCIGTTAQLAYDEISKHVEIKMKSSGEKAVDSIAIKFDPVYFKMGKCTGTREKEYEYIKDGYKIWILETADTFRIEVIRIDTLGYIYKR